MTKKLPQENLMLLQMLMLFAHPTQTLLTSSFWFAFLCICFSFALHLTQLRCIHLLSTALSFTPVLWNFTNFQVAKFCALAIRAYCYRNLNMAVSITKMIQKILDTAQKWEYLFWRQKLTLREKVNVWYVISDI